MNRKMLKLKTDYRCSFVLGRYRKPEKLLRKFCRFKNNIIFVTTICEKEKFLTVQKNLNSGVRQ